MQLNGTVYKPLNWSVVLAALLIVILLAGCDRRQQAPPSPPVPEVSTVTVQTQKIMLTTELPGRTSAFRVAEIRPQVSGLIQKRLFTEGSDVKAGQVLYQIDPAPFQAALDNAGAALSRAEANLPSIRSRAERYKELLVDKAVSQQDYDDAAAALTQVQADIQYWKATVETARINLEDETAYPPEGTLQFSDVTVDPTTGSVILRVVFPNPKGVLLPGMFVRAVIKEGVNEQAILVPQQSVSRDHKGNPFALIVNAEGKVDQRMLTLDGAIGDKWLVSSGLTSGDRVVVEGLQMLRPGAAVKVVPFKQDGTKRATPENTARPIAESN